MSSTIAVKDFNRSASEDGSFNLEIQDKNVKQEDIKKELREVYDPEISINIFELGLIYHCDVIDGKCITLMTLTSPFCPVAGEMPIWTKEALLKVPGINEVEVEMTFEPTFSPSQMSELAQMTLNLDGDTGEDEYVTDYHRFR
jgi:metal-sulfur cluster biosynthetic enzyme